MIPMNWSYVAGFFDGEGNINVSPCYGKCRGSSYLASMCQSGSEGIEVLQSIKTFLHAEGIPSMFRAEKPRENCRRMYVLRVWGRTNLKLFLSKIYPFLVVKRVKALDTIRLLKIFPNLQPAMAKIANTFIKRRDHNIDIQSILNDRKNGLSISTIAKKHGISTSATHRVTQGKHWKQREALNVA